MRDNSAVDEEVSGTDLQALAGEITASPDESQIGPEEALSSYRIQTVRPQATPLSVLDVADYILRKLGRMSTMKLQKLVYYCQAWSLVWDERPLFEEDVEAWANGPVVRKLFDYHRGMYDIDRVYTGNPGLLDEEQKKSVDAVLDFYGSKSAQWLIELSHSERPWREARRGLLETARSSRVISLDSMANYYSSFLDEALSADD